MDFSGAENSKKPPDAHDRNAKSFVQHRPLPHFSYKLSSHQAIMSTFLLLFPLLVISMHQTMAFSPVLVHRTTAFSPVRGSSLFLGKTSEENSMSRRDTLATLVTTLVALPSPSLAKCTDIESCREVGEAKDLKDLERNPIHRLSNGIEYKVLDEGSPSSPSTQTVAADSSVDIAFSVSQANGRYMYSRGFGFEKVEFMGKMTRDRDIDSLRVDMGKKNVPVGIEQVLVGMKKGEKRRVVLPPEVGFDTSDWQPAPVKRDAQRQMEVYRTLVRGNGAQPPFAAPTIWDVEVLRIRA